MTAAAEAPKRRYDNSLRRERANETRERIVAAGVELVPRVVDRRLARRHDAGRGGTRRCERAHRLPPLPQRAALRDAVMQQLEQSVGIELANLTLDRIPDAAARMVRHLSSYPPHARPPLDPTLVEANRRQHDALLAAVKEHADRWTAADRTLAAAMLDVLWASPTYERLARNWNLDAEESIRGITWVIGLIEDAIHTDGRPPRTRRARHDEGAPMNIRPEPLRPELLRVVQWTTGNVGRRSVRAIVTRPDLELVGCYAWSADKVGRDVGELCGIEPVGVAATDDVDTLLALRPDCVVYNPMWQDVDELVRILEAGVNVVSTAAFINGRNLGTGRDRIADGMRTRRVDDVRHRGESRFRGVVGHRDGRRV